MEQHQMIVVAFEFEDDAKLVLDTLKDLEKQQLVDVKGAAVIVKQTDGKVKIKESSDFDAKQGAIGGAVAGGLLGLLRGNPVRGALIGAAGGAAAGKFIDLGLDDKYLKEVGESLSFGGSAVVATVDFLQVDQAMADLDRFQGGRILRHTLSPEVYRKLSEAVED